MSETDLPMPTAFPAAPAPAPPVSAPPPRIDARALTGPGGQALLVLDDKTYSLRITRAGKLILTK
jgi:hemin uptake protein HemP